MDVDPEFTKDWLNFCLGRYSFKAPPWMGDDTFYDYNFDGYKLELFENKTENNFERIVSQKKQEISELSMPQGLNSVIYKEITEENYYLVGYRHLGNKAPESITIDGFAFVNGNILKISMSTSDSYKSDLIGYTNEKGKVYTKEVWDKIAFDDFGYGQSILQRAKGIKDPSKVGKGYCVNGKVLIAGKPQSESLESLNFANKPKQYTLFIDVRYKNSPPPDRKPFFQPENENDTVYFMNINGFHGSVIRRDDMRLEYGWVSEEWNNQRDFNKPFMRIGYSEGIEPPYDGGNEIQDKIFENILASFQFRK